LPPFIKGGIFAFNLCHRLSTAFCASRQLEFPMPIF
jgi:hypothetical protein